MPAAKDLYDVFAYPGFSYANTHPDRLAVMGILHGLSPAAVENCRVLEVACGDGANLIPMAYAMPGSEFVGFDLAQLPVERAQERIGELGLKNARVFQGDLLGVGAELGKFDYIIAHGLYAWVPEEVRDRLLALCSELLAPEGIAFVSYNALPGGYLRKAMREMMLFRVEGIEDPEQKVAAGKEFLHLIAGTRPESDANRVLIEERLKRMEGHKPGATFHDEMAPVYLPVYFSEFAAHAQRQGLQYLSDAEIPPPQDPCYRGEVRTVLEEIAAGDFLRQEQMLDYMRMRPYRETLLCKADRPLRRYFAADDFKRLLFASQAAPCEGEAEGSNAFAVPGGARIESNHPGVIRLLEELGKAWPRALSFDEIASRVEGTGLTFDGEGATLLMRLAVSRMMELRAWRAPVAEGISARPRASACSRQEGRMGAAATSLLHLTVTLDDEKVRGLLQLLDGSRDRKELAEAMKKEFPAAPVAEIEEGLEPSLRLFYMAGVLEA